MRLPRLFRTNLFRLTLAYMALSALSVGALSAFIYWATLGYLDNEKTIALLTWQQSADGAKYLASLAKAIQGE